MEAVAATLIPHLMTIALTILSVVLGCALFVWGFAAYLRRMRMDPGLPWEARITRRPRLRRDFERWLRRMVEDAVHGTMDSPRAFDVERAAYLQATADSARYFGEKMRLARVIRSRGGMIEFALKAAELEGFILEFGVAGGDSLSALARLVGERRTVYGFDSFEGLPEDWTHFQREGRYERGGRPPEGLPPNAEVVVGRFGDSLPGFFAEHRGPLRLAHIDCDLYSSTRTVLEHLAPRVYPGAVLLFDEYFNYPGWKHHEFKAFQEVVAERGWEYEYLALVPSKFSVLVRITKI